MLCTYWKIVILTYKKLYLSKIFWIGIQSFACQEFLERERSKFQRVLWDFVVWRSGNTSNSKPLKTITILYTTLIVNFDYTKLARYLYFLPLLTSIVSTHLNTNRIWVWAFLEKYTLMSQSHITKITAFLT